MYCSVFDGNCQITSRGLSYNLSINLFASTLPQTCIESVFPCIFLFFVLYNTPVVWNCILAL